MIIVLLLPNRRELYWTVGNLLVLLGYPLLLLSDKLRRLLLELLMPAFVNEAHRGCLIALAQSNGGVWELTVARFLWSIRFVVGLMDNVSGGTTVVLFHLVRRWQL